MAFKKVLKKELLLELILFSSGIAAISVLWKNNFLLTILLLIGWLIGFKLWHKKQDFYFFVIGAIVGPIGEIVCIHFGAWKYSNPSFLGIPVWLPFVWGLAVILIKRLAETFMKIEMR